MAAIFGEGKIFWKLKSTFTQIPYEVENSPQIALSRTVTGAINPIWTLPFLAKIREILNGRH